MFAGARRLDGCVEREQIGLAGDFLDDAYLLGNHLHRAHGPVHRLTADIGILSRLARDLLGLCGIVGVLLDVRSHLFHRGRGLFGGSGLLGRALRDLFGARRQFLAARGDIADGSGGIRHHDAQSLHHADQGLAQHVLVRLRLGLHGQVALGNVLRDLRHGFEIRAQPGQVVCQLIGQPAIGAARRHGGIALRERGDHHADVAIGGFDGGHASLHRADLVLAVVGERVSERAKRVGYTGDRSRDGAGHQQPNAQRCQNADAHADPDRHADGLERFGLSLLPVGEQGAFHRDHFADAGA